MPRAPTPAARSSSSRRRAPAAAHVLARAFAEGARRHLPQPITVINRPGASGMIGHGSASRASTRLSMGHAYADAETFRASMKRDDEVFRAPVTKLGIKA